MPRVPSLGGSAARTKKPACPNPTNPPTTRSQDGPSTPNPTVPPIPKSSAWMRCWLTPHLPTRRSVSTKAISSPRNKATFPHLPSSFTICPPIPSACSPTPPPAVGERTSPCSPKTGACFQNPTNPFSVWFPARICWQTSQPPVITAPINRFSIHGPTTVQQAFQLSNTVRSAVGKTSRTGPRSTRQCPQSAPGSPAALTVSIPTAQVITSISFIESASSR